MVSYLVGGYSYLSGAWGTDTQSYVAMLVWIDKYFPHVPFWYPLAGGGVSITHAYPVLSFYLVSLVKRLFEINLFGSLSAVGFGSIVLIAISIYAFVSLRFKNQTAAFMAAIFYLISPISWTWLSDWGFYAESISHVFVVPTILFWDLFFTSFIEKNYGKLTRIYLFLTILFLTLTTGTHFLTGYAVMGVFYLYVLVYSIFSKGKMKQVFFSGTIALIVVGIFSLTATAAFSVPFARYTKFAATGGISGATAPSLKDYQNALPSIENVIGMSNIKKDSPIYGMRDFKFPMVVSICSFLGIIFYSWKDKRKWVFSIYILYGFFVAFNPFYYVYILNKFPIWFIASSLGWRPVYAIMRVAVPIMAGLGIVGMANLPFYFIKNKFLKYPTNIVAASIALFVFVMAINWQIENYQVRKVVDFGAQGLDIKNVWQVKDEKGHILQRDFCPTGDEVFNTDEDKKNFVNKFNDIGGYERWCNSSLTNYFPPIDIGDWCSNQSKSGNNNLPILCSPESLNVQKVKDFWQNCQNNPNYSAICKSSYEPLVKQLALNRWPRPQLASGYDPNEGLNSVLKKIEVDNPVARVDFSPYMGGDSMMSPFYNVNRYLSQIHIYVASASLIQKFQGFQQAVYYLNSPMYDDPVMLNDINKWFGINYVFDVPNVYSTNEENIFKRAGWDIFDGEWGNGIYKYPQKNSLAELSSKKTVLVIGQKKYSTYDQVFTMSLLGVLPYDSNILVWGNDNVDDYSLADLEKFDTLILQGYTYKNKNKADKLLSSYVENGGGIFIDTGWQYKNPDWEGKNTLSVIPLKNLSWNDLGKTSDFAKSNDGSINSDVDTNSYGPLSYGDGSWGVSTSDPSDLKQWAKVEVSVSGKPIIVSGVFGKGKIVWSGMNIFAHAKQKEVIFAGEIKTLKNSFNWLSNSKEPKNYDVSYTRINPDEVEFTLPQTSENTYLLWKEGFYPDFKASLLVNNKSVPLNILRAGPGLTLIEIPKLDSAAKVVYEYKTPLAEQLADILSVMSFAVLLGLIFEGFRGDKSFVQKIELSIENKFKKLNAKSWLKDDSGDENY